LQDQFVDIGGGAETLGVHRAVVGGVRFGQPREFAGGGPVETARIHDGSAQGNGVTVHIFGGGVHDNVRPEIDRPAVDGRRKGVVDDKRHTHFVRDARELGDVEHDEGGICQRLGEKRTRFGAERRLNLRRGRVRVDESDGYAKFFQRDGEKVEGAAVNGGGTDNVPSGLADIENGIERGGLAGSGQRSAGAAFERGDFRGHRVVGRILKARIKVPLPLKVEEPAHLLARIVFESGALDNRYRAGFAVFRRITRVDAVGFNTAFVHVRPPLFLSQTSLGIRRAISSIFLGISMVWGHFSLQTPQAVQSSAFEPSGSAAYAARKAAASPVFL